jgi:hypothetical protein
MFGKLARRMRKHRGKAANTRRRPGLWQRFRRLGLERLEDRTLLSVDLTAIPTWQAQGPGPIWYGQSLTPPQANEVVGAVQTIAVNPSNRDNVFIATANGGIWETNDATDPEPGWQPLTDQYPSLSIGSIAFSPFNNVLYAGTANVSNTNRIGATNGVLESVDGGQHWSIVGADEFQSLSIVSIVPTSLDSGNVVLLATANGFFTGPPGTNVGGVYRSDDGGRFWNRWSGGHGLPEAGVSDLVEDPGNASRFYAAVPGIGIYRSDDGGVSWQSITNDLATQITDLATSSRIRLAVSESFPAAVYTGVIDKNGQLEGLFQSTPTDNPGDVTWTSLGAVPPTIQTNPGKQGLTNFSIVVDPNYSNIVYVGGDRRDSPPYVGNIYKVNAATGDWTAITDVGQPATAPHADSRTMVFDGGGDLIEGDDGGIYRLQSPAAPGAWSSMNGNLENTEFYSVAYDSLNHEIIGGSQDTGVSQQDQTRAPFPAWVAPDLGPNPSGTRDYAAGDGGNVAFAVDSSDPSTPASIHYFMGNNFSQFYRTAYKNGQQQNIGNYSGIDFTNPLNNGLKHRVNYVAASVLLADPNHPDIWLSGLNAVDSVLAHSGDFEVIPYVLNNINPGRMLIGRTDLYESRDQGDTITDITPFGMNQVTALAYGGYSSGVANADLAYVGAINQLWLRTTPGGSFQLLKGWSDIGGGAGWLNGPRRILMDPNDWHTVFVIDDHSIIEGTGVGTPDEKWKVIQGPFLLTESTQLGVKRIPQYFTGELITINGTEVLLIGTNSGVYRLINPDQNTVWTKYGTGLPNGTVTDLHYNASDDVLIAGTRGRGAWKITSASTTLATPSVLPIQFDTPFDTIRLVRDPYNPLVLDVVQNGINLTPQLPMSAVQEIDVTALGGSDDLIVDGSNGMIQVDQFIYTGGDQGTQLEIDGNPGDVFTNLPIPNLPNTGYVVVQGKDMGDIGERIFYSHVPVVDTTLGNPLGSPQTVLDTLRNGLQTLFGWSAQLANPSLLDRNLPVVGRALGDLLNGVSPITGSAAASDADTGPASPVALAPGGVQGSSFLQRIFETGQGGFPIGDIGTSIITFDQLQRELQALGNGTALVSYATDNSGGVRFDFQVQATLSGTVPIDLPIQSAGLDLKGLADISADIRIHLIFGVDPNGFFIDVASNPDPMAVVSNLRVTGNVGGDTTFGNLDISLTDGTLSVDPELQLAVKLSPPGQDPLNQADDGYLRLVELNADPAKLATGHLSTDTFPSAANVTFSGTFAIATVDGSQPPIKVTSPQLNFTWFDPTIPQTPQVTGGNVDGQALLGYLIAPVGGGQPSSVNNFGSIPNPIDISQGQQTLFGFNTTTQQIPTGGQTGTISTFLQFAASGTGPQTTIQFNLTPANDSASGDKAALALYDSLGNQIQIAADEPIPGHPGIEGLSATLTTGQVYYLGVFFDAANASDVFNLTTHLGAQSMRQAIGLDLTSGDSGQVSDTFTTPATVNYYPLNLLDAGSSAMVTITPTGLDADPYAAVYRRGLPALTQPGSPDAAWQLVASNSGTQAFSLSLTPPADKSLTDAQYLLVTAPQGFDTAARSYTIDLQSPLPLLAPATIDVSSATTLLMTSADASTAQAEVYPIDQPNQTLQPGGQLLFQFLAPADGTATLSLRSVFEPQLSVYDGTGMQLLAVATSTIPRWGTALMSLPVQAGDLYTVRVSDVLNQNGGIFDLKIRTPYAASPLPAVPVPVSGTQAYGSVTPPIPISVGPNTGGEYFQLTPTVGTQILVFQIQPGAGGNPIAPQLTLIGPNGFQQTFRSQAALYATVDISHQAGPFVLYVASTTGSDPATMKVGEVQIPTSLGDSDTDLQGTSADLGGTVNQTLPAANFGTLTGVKFTQVPTNGVKFKLSVDEMGSPQPLLVHYKFNGSSFQLVDFALPSPTRPQHAELKDKIIPDNEVDAVAAISLDVDNAAGNTFQITALPESPLPIPGIGVGMVPTSPPTGGPSPRNAPTPDFEHDPFLVPYAVQFQQFPQTTPWQSRLAIQGVSFQHAYDQHLWKTILPFDVHDYGYGDGGAVVEFQPTGTSALQVRLRVYLISGSPDQLTTPILDITSSQYAAAQGVPAPGVTMVLPLKYQDGNLQDSDLAGTTLVFQITPLSGLNPDGAAGYSLFMIADTTDPHPFEVTDNTFTVDPSSVINVVQNQFGHGEAQGDISSNDPTQPGSVQVFRFWAINPGPVVVKTIDDNPGQLNTDLKVFKAHYASDGSLEYLQEISGVPPSFDWFPADRSRIDAQSYINDSTLLQYTADDFDSGSMADSYGTGAGEYFVVVKGQEGTTGTYRLVVDTPSMPVLGANPAQESEGNAYLRAENAQAANISPTTGGTIALNAYFGDVPGLIGYLPIQVPAYHTGLLNVSSYAGFASTGYWDMALFDAQGNELPGTVSNLTYLGIPYTNGDFTVPDGPQIVYLRVRNKESTAPAPGSQLFVTMSLGNIQIPPDLSNPAGDNAILETNPQGDGSHSASSSNATNYWFQAPRGPLTVRVVPDPSQAQQLVWAVYVDGNLLAWNVTQAGADPSTMTATFSLPDLRQPVANPDYPYDLATPEDVQLYVSAGTYTVSVATSSYVVERDLVNGQPVDSNGDLFAAFADSGPVLPMRNADVAINPLAGASSVATVTGMTWEQLDVPEGYSGSVQLNLFYPGNVGISPTFHYDLYSIGTDGNQDFTGQLLATGTAVGALNPLGFFIGTFYLPESLPGGASYYLRVGVEEDPTDAQGVLTLQASVTLAKDSGDNLPYPNQIIPLNTPADGLFKTLDPSPDGSVEEDLINQNPINPQDQNTPLDETRAFWVGAGGLAQFDVPVINTITIPPNRVEQRDPDAYVALFRVSGGSNSDGSTFYSLTLVDFVDDANLNGSVGTVGGQSTKYDYQLSAHVDPGLYVIQVVSNTTPSFIEANIDGQLPVAPFQEIVLDPNTGESVNDLQERTIASGGINAPADPNFVDAYRSVFYHIVTPSNSTPGPSASPGLVVNAADPFRGDATRQTQGYDAGMQVWIPTAGVPPWTVPANLNPAFPPPRIVAQQSYFDPQPAPPLDGNVTLADPAPPGQDYVIGLFRHDLIGTVDVTASFQVPHSGTPDLVVEPLKLSPDNGNTLISVQVRNQGYFPSKPTTSWQEFTDAAKASGSQLISMSVVELQIGELDFANHVFSWVTPGPDTPDDTVSYVVNSTVAVDVTNPANEQVMPDPNCPESDYTNNIQTVALKAVDPIRPAVLYFFSDPAMNGYGDVDASGTWGRYVAGVAGAVTDITVHATDVLNGVHGSGLYSLDVEGPGSAQYGTTWESGITADRTLPRFDFGSLSATEPNVFTAVAKDVYGLRSDLNAATKTVEVVAAPDWLVNGPAGSGITFDFASHRYQLRYHNALVDLKGTLNQLLQTSIPLVGGNNNEFLIEVTATGTAGLDPNEPINLAATGHVLLDVIGESIFDHTYGAGQVADHLSFDATLQVNSHSLRAETVTLSFGISGLDLANIQTPEIPLLALGLPGVLAAQVSIQFGFGVSLDAALTVQINVNNGQTELMTPTFIQPDISGSATLSGEVTVLGFDAAKVSGSAILDLKPDYALQSDGSFSLQVGLSLRGHIEADLLGITVWQQDIGPYNFAPTPLPQSGDQAIGSINIEPSPNLIVDATTGNALYVQTINVAPAGSPVQGNLAFDERTNDKWPPTLTTLSESTFASNPVLAWTNDQSGATPAVVVYNEIDTSDPTTLTENQFLTGQNLRYRYFDGTNWGSEQTLLADSLYNSQPAMSFNASGRGVVAWVNNTNPTPVDVNGNLDRSSNEIEAAIWDRQNHVWSLPQQLTSNSVSDSQPAVFADPSGSFYLVWLEDTASGNQVMYSIYSGGAWSTPAVLPINGLPAGGSVSQIAIGSERSGRIDVVTAYSVQNSDGTAVVGLYNRPSTTAGFINPAYAELVARHADFSHLRTLQTTGGGLLAYWQQSDGVTNDIFASKIGPATSVWSAPMRLTNDSNPLNYGGPPPGSNLPVAPSVAVDTNGSYQVVYEMATAAANNNPGMGTLDVPIGIPAVGGAGTSNDQLAPELYFSQPMFFPYRNVAPNGGNTIENGAAPGTQVTAEAQIVNRGLTQDNVELDFFDGLPGSGTQVGSETISLAPGQTYDISFPFTVLAGTQTYSIQATALGGVEVTGATPHVTSATLVGLGDIAVTRTLMNNPRPKTGDTVNVTADIANLSNVPFGSFDVSLYLGDPAVQPNLQPIATTTVNGLDAFGQVTVSLPWTVPAGGGSFELTILADSGDVLQEVTRANNEGQVAVSVLPDAAVIGAVQANLVDYSGINNVQVSANIGNIGQADLANVPVELEWSWAGGQFQPVAQTTLASLAAGTSRMVTFNSGGFAGTNIYRIVVDPGMTLPDANWSNNVAQTALMIEGLPDLRINDFSLVSPDTTQVPTVQAVIQNAGIAPAQSVPVEVFLVPANTGNDQATIEAIGQVVGETSLSELDPLANTPVTMQLSATFAQIAGQELAMIVDPDNSVMLKDHVHTVATIQVGTQDTCVSFNLDQNGVLTIMKNCADAGNDTINVDMTPAGGVSASFNNDSIQFNPGVVTAIVVDGGDGNDTINVEKTPAGVPVTVNLGAGTDTVYVSPTAQLLQNVGGTVTVNGGSGTGSVTIDDQLDTLPAQWTVTGTGVMAILNGGLTESINYAGLKGVTINDGTGGDSFSVQSTAAGTATTIQGRAGDTVNVGKSGSVQGILGPLTVAGGNALVVDDSADPAPRTVTMNSTSITNLAPASITYSGIASLTMDGGFGGNTIGVQNTAAGTNTTVNSGNGPDVVYVRGTTGPLTVNTQQGNVPGGGFGFDGIEVGALIPNVGYTLDSIQGALTVNTSQGGGNLGLLDSAATASEQYTLTSDTITRSGMAPIHYVLTNELSFLLGSGGDNVNVLSTEPTLATVFEGGVGNDTFNVGDSANTLNGIQGHLSFGIANPGSRVILNDQGNLAPVNYRFASTLTGVGIVPSIARSSTGYLIFYSGPLQQLTLNTSTGGDTVNVQSIPSSTTVTINGSGTDKVDVGNAVDGVGDIQGAVNITNNPAAGDYTALTVDDSTYNRGYWWSTLTNSSLTTNRRTDTGSQVQLGTIGFNQNDLSSLKILLGNSPGGSGNIVFVTDTPSHAYPDGMMTTITSGIGAGVNDAIFIGATTGPLTANLNNDGLHPASSAFLGTGSRSLDNMRGPVTVNSLSGWTDVVINDTANANGETYTITGSTIAFRPNLPVLTYHVSNELQFDAGSGVNTVNVNSMSTSTVIGAGASGNDVVNIGGPANTLDGFTDGYLGIHIDNPGSRVLLNDQGNPNARNYNFTFLPANLPSVVRTDSAGNVLTEMFFTGPLQNLTLNGSNGGDTYNIENTSFPTFIHNHASDMVNVGNAGSVQGIVGPVTVDAANTMMVDDSADPTGRTVTLTPTSITGLAPAAINYGPGVAKLTVDGGLGGNTIVVKNTAAGTNTTVNSGNGVDTVYVEGTTGPLTVNTQQTSPGPGSGGFDSVWIGFSAAGYTLDTIQGAVTVNAIGRPGIDYANVAIDDSAEKSAEQFTITSNTIQRSGAALITYTVTNELDFFLGSGGNTVNVQSLTGRAPTFISGGVGNDTFNVGDAANTLNGIPYQFIIQIANPGSQVNLNDQGNSSSLGYTLQPVVIHRTSTLSWPAYQLLRSDWDPSGHITFVDVTGPLQNLALNTGPGNHAFNAQGLPPYNNTQVAINGGAGVNTLQGPNAANNWQVTGPNVGTLDASIGFTSIQNLVGGAQADSFVVQNGGGVSGTIDGAAGSDSYTVYLGSLAPPVLTIADSGPSTDADSLTAKAAPGTNYIVKTATQITWGNPATEIINYSGIENLTIDLSAGTNNTVIDPGSQNTTIIGGPGTNNITIANTVGNGVVFQDGGGTNNITIDMGNLQGPVTINGTTGTTQVTIVAPAGSNILTLSGTQLTGAGETIDFNLGTTLTNLTVDGSAGQNQLVVQGTPPGPLTLTNVIVGTTTSVSPSANPASFGQPLTLAASVAALIPAAGTPTGSVDFFDTTTGVDLGTVALASGSASLITADLPLGSNTITVSYGGATDFLTSTTSLTVNVLSSIIVLDPAVAGALSLSGSASIIEPGNVWVDSDASALQASGNASLSASSIQVVGGVSRSGNASFNPTPVTGVAALSDPLAGLAAPSGGTAQGSVNLTHGSLTINPGIYSSIRVSGSGSLTLNPGIYVLVGGGLTVTGNASITGSGVLLYNAGSNYPNGGGNFGGIALSGNGSVTLSAATTGAYAGIVLFQARANTRALSLGGSAVLGLTGVIYAPSAQVLVSGNAQLNASLVVDRLTLSGNGVSTQVADGAAGSVLDGASAGTLLAGDLDVYINDPAGYFTANKQARIQDAINTWDTLLVPYSVVITEVSDPTLANVVIDTATASAAGTAADGVLGSYSSSGEITVLQGWNWYDGADLTQIGSGQYDFQTVVTHELGHALGLGGSTDPNSPMYEVLAAGVVRRTPSVADLNIPEPPDGADPERAASVPAAQQVFVMVVAGQNIQGVQDQTSAATAPPLADSGSVQTKSSSGLFGSWPQSLGDRALPQPMHLATDSLAAVRDPGIPAERAEEGSSGLLDWGSLLSGLPNYALAKGTGPNLPALALTSATWVPSLSGPALGSVTEDKLSAGHAAQALPLALLGEDYPEQAMDLSAQASPTNTRDHQLSDLLFAALCAASLKFDRDGSKERGKRVSA